MMRFHDRRNATGFSLLEVLVAVVVLTVGLLALAALQGSLTRSSAEAKARGRVAAMLTAHMDEMRSSGYGNLLPEGAAAQRTSIEGVAGDTCDNVDETVDPDDWLDCARVQSNMGSLTLDQTITTWYGNGTFTTPAPILGSQDPRVAQFKRVGLSATWSDAAGTSHTQQLVSDVSSMSLTNFVVVPPDPTENPTGGPIVRTINPATAGVIPIAMGTQDDQSVSATTNPTPELVGQKNNQQIVGTRYSVLNYTPPTFGNSVVVTKRFDNEVIKCSCRFGAGGSNLPEIYRTAMWPAIWNGEGYVVHVPDGNIAAPGQTKNAGPRSGVTQSDLCQECCRDHHDTGSNTDVRFDPEHGGTVSKYDADNQGALTLQTNTLAGTYVDSCRLVRVDGFWRTAADVYQRQFGLLETQPVNNVPAKSGAPTQAAVDAYTAYVRTYLAKYTGNSSTEPSPGAQADFDATAMATPALITIPTVSNTDYRYLHARALYVDYLEQDARDKLVDVLADDDPQGPCPDNTPAADCVMPFLPFTTANLTEIAKWTAEYKTIINVNDSNLLATNPAQPSGGRTTGLSNGDSKNTSEMRKSNSGLAVYSPNPKLTGVTTNDKNDVRKEDQPFTVGGAPGPTFDVRVSGAGANPFVFFTLGVDNNVECLKPAGTDHRCATSSGTTLPQSGTVTFSNYWQETTTLQSVTTQCGNRTLTQNVQQPTFYNYVLTSATINGVEGVIGASTNDATIRETTSVLFPAISQGTLVIAVFSAQAGASPIYATPASCKQNGTITWSKSWL